MDSTTAMRDLARRLLAVEAARNAGDEQRHHEAVRLCDKLRGAISRLAGAAGFAALLRRTLALARREVPAVAGIQILPDGCLDGLERLAAESPLLGRDAALAITAHLLDLLATFIGQPLTLQIVGDLWPEEDRDDTSPQKKP